MPSLRRLAAVLVAALAAAGVVAQTSDPPPVSADLEESVEVRLVTLDIVAMDGQGRTVTDLTKDDVDLIVDGTPTPIDAWDITCTAGPEPDPNGKGFGTWAASPNLADGTRRVVFVFDYLHLPSTPCPTVGGPCFYHTRALQDYQRVLAAKTGIDDEEMMVVALTGGLRIEQPFTKDRQVVIDTLHRMEHDISLWNGNFTHTNENGFFSSLRALVHVLGMTPGPKVVVFISAGGGPSDAYELDYENLAADASVAQVAFYTVDCMGTFAVMRETNGAVAGTGGPPGLAKLASLTGGRLTRNSNDFTVGYARARRDLGCRYTLSFYDRRPKADRRHRMEVISHRPDVHLYYAARYTFPSLKERHMRSVEAAYIVPTQFEGGGLRAHLFPVQLKDGKTWSAILAVDFPADIGDGTGPVTREFGVVLRRGPNVAFKFSRTITLEPPAGLPRGTVPRVTFVEPVDLPAGSYALTAVLNDPAGETPYGTASDLTLPPIPKRGAILAGPILGRRRGDDVVVYGEATANGSKGDRVGSRDSFRPLLIDDVNRDEPLAALTNVCVVRPKPSDGPWSVARRLATSQGEAAGSLVDFAFGARPLETGAPVQCERLFDEIPVSNLKPGAYTFRAVLETVGEDPADAVAAEVPFAVGAGN